jgi:hypothetical protein
MAEVAVSRQMFEDILILIARVNVRAATSNLRDTKGEGVSLERRRRASFGAARRQNLLCAAGATLLGVELGAINAR